MTVKRQASNSTSPSNTSGNAYTLPVDTPLKQSASNSRSSTLYPWRPPRKRSRTSGSTATTDTVVQDSIADRLKDELNGAVFHDPNFFDSLPCDDAQLARVLDACPLFDGERGTWRTPAPSGEEKRPYRPIIEVLDAIGEAVHSTRPSPGTYVPFLNKSNRTLGSSYTGMHTAPDIIKCELDQVENQPIHWCEVDLFVEVKKSGKQVVEAIRQSARYTRSLLAHRIDRRFVKALVRCGTTAVFLHFDRSGMIYSDDIDIYTDAKRFAQGLASLLLLGRTAAGYNTMFKNLRTPGAGQRSTLEHRLSVAGVLYMVAHILCNRKSIRGRSTLVLALRKILERMDSATADRVHDESGTIDAVLKLLWRDPNRFQESLVLNEFLGVFGICQILSEADAAIDGEPNVVYPRTGFVPGPRGHVFGRSNTNVDIVNAPIDDARVLSRLVMQPGRPLWQAKDPEELKAAFVGAIMGQWALVNSDVQHRDNSVHNIPLPFPNHQHEAPEWELLAELGAEAYGQAFKAPEWEKTLNNSPIAKYKKDKQLRWKFDPKRRFTMLKRIIAILGLRPFGFLSDVDLANILSPAREEGSDMHTHRAGTLSFMAVNLLLAKPTKPIPHSYLHDLESFFWVLLYVVAEHQADGVPRNEDAQDILSDLNTVDCRTLGLKKTFYLYQLIDGSLDVRSFGTSWATSLAPLIEKFAEWVVRVKGPRFDSTADPDTCFEQVLELFLPLTEDPQAPRAEHSFATVRQGSQAPKACVCTATCHRVTVPQDKRPLEA